MDIKGGRFFQLHYVTQNWKRFRYTSNILKRRFLEKSKLPCENWFFWVVQIDLSPPIQTDNIKILKKCKNRPLYYISRICTRNKKWVALVFSWNCITLLTCILAKCFFLLVCCLFVCLFVLIIIIIIIIIIIMIRTKLHLYEEQINMTEP